MKVHIKALIIATVVMFFVIFVSPTVVHASYMERGYFAIGGEWILNSAVVATGVFSIYKIMQREIAKIKTQHGLENARCYVKGFLDCEEIHEREQDKTAWMK